MGRDCPVPSRDGRPKRSIDRHDLQLFGSVDMGCSLAKQRVGKWVRTYPEESSANRRDGAGRVERIYNVRLSVLRSCNVDDAYKVETANYWFFHDSECSCKLSRTTCQTCSPICCCSVFNKCELSLNPENAAMHASHCWGSM